MEELSGDMKKLCNSWEDGAQSLRTAAQVGGPSGLCKAGAAPGTLFPCLGGECLGGQIPLVPRVCTTYSAKVFLSLSNRWEPQGTAS